MATVRTLIGYIKGPKGDTGATGATGAQGPAGNDGAPGVTDYASTSAAGLVRVGDDFNINSSNGALSIKNAFTEASSLANISTGESQATILGKIKKFMTTLMPSNFLINTVNSTATDKALTANMGKTLAGDLATVQTSATASKAYAVGEYLVLNGKLYKVTAAIANGGTITVGTNVTATNAGAQLKSLNDSLNDNVGYTYNPNYTYTNQTFDGTYGFVTGGGTNAWLFIPMCFNRKTADGMIAHFTNLKIGMRISTGGYLGDVDSFDALSYISSVTLKKAQGICVVVLEKSDGWGATNNTPIVGRVNSATFSIS